MDYQAQMLQELESAARLVLASAVSNDDRSKAEMVFTDFRNMKSPYGICKYIFETSKLDYVVFEATNTLKGAIIREWNTLAAADIISIREYILRHLYNNPGIAVFVREKMLQAIAIIIKRGSVTDKGAERAKLLIEVEHLILSGNMHKQILGCGIISALLQEYGCTHKTSNVGFTLEMHINLKIQFETSDLKMIFKLCLRMLSEISQINVPLPENAEVLLKSFLQISEAILSWSYLSHVTFMFIFEIDSDNSMPLILPCNWDDTVLDPGVVQLFFHLHWKIRGNPHLSHYTLNCLVQLSSLGGPIFKDKEVNVRYVTNYLECFVNFITNVEIMDREAYGISQIPEKLNIFKHIVVLNSIPRHLSIVCLEQLSKLTCLFAENAARDISLNYDESLFSEAFDNILQVWVSILNHSATHPLNSGLPPNFCENTSIQVFDSYLRWHLSPPHGSRTQEIAEEEVHELEEEDRDKFHFQLQTIGMFARTALDHTLPILSKLIEEKTIHIQSYYQLPLQNSVNERNALSEDLHWLLTIASHVLTLNEDGSCYVIPNEIMKFSADHMKEISMENSFKLLTLLDYYSISESEREILNRTSDQVIRLISCIFRLTALENVMLEAKLNEYLSPMLASTSAWALNIWSMHYLMLSETDYVQLSLPLVETFGEDATYSKSTIDFLLNKVRINILYFSDDITVIENTLQILIGLTDNPKRSNYIIKSEKYWELMHLYDDEKNCNLIPKVKQSLARASVLIGKGISGSQHVAQFYDQVFSPLIKRFENIVLDGNFRHTYHEEQTRYKICDTLDRLIGMVNGSSTTTGLEIYTIIDPILQHVASLIGLYHSYQQITHLILDFFETASCTILYFITGKSADMFYSACMRIVELYVQFNMGNITIDKDAKEQTLEDILIFINIMKNLLQKNTKGCNVRPIDICIQGLKGLIPLMSVDMLKFPDLCNGYYTLLAFACEKHVDEICKQPRDFLVNILATVEIGLTIFNITTPCYDFINTLATYFIKNSNDIPSDIYNLLKPFTKIFFTLILSRQVSSSSIPNFGYAFYRLMCCYKEYYMQLVSELVNSQPDQEIAQRISNEFSKLTNDLPFDLSIAGKSQFNDRFECFLVQTRAFLFVK